MVNDGEHDLEIAVTFEGLSSAEANQAAQELRAMLTDRIAGLGAELRKDNPDTQDMGATLVLLFGTGTAVAVAQGIRNYITKRGSRVQIRTPAGEIIATGDAATNIDVARTVAALQATRAPRRRP